MGYGLVGESNVFEKKDGQKYTINQANAKKLVSILKARKEILSGAEYIVAHKDYERKEESYNEEINNIKKYRLASDIADSKEFAEITQKVNAIIDNYNRLDDMEYKASRGNALTFIANTIRKAFDLKPVIKVPKKVLKLREELATQIDELIQDSNKNAKNKKAFNAYITARKSFGDGYTLSVDRLQVAKQELRVYGVERVELPMKKIDVAQLKLQSGYWATTSEQRASELEAKKAEAKEKSDAMYSKLSKKTKQMIETQGEDSILYYAQKYYDFDGARDRFRKFADSKAVSAGASAMILESILKRKNLAWEDIYTVYGDILGRTEEKENQVLNNAVTGTVNRLKQRITGMVEKADEEHETMGR